MSDERYFWAGVILALEARSWSLVQIADEIGLSPTATSEIKHLRTSRPGGMAAVRLYELHRTKAMPPKKKSRKRQRASRARAVA